MYPALQGGVKAPNQGGETEWVPRLRLLKTSKITTDVSKWITIERKERPQHPNWRDEGMMIHLLQKPLY